MAFQDLRAKAPPIHACDRSGQTTLLEPAKRQKDRNVDPGCIPIKGDGSPEHPYEVRKPTGLSRHTEAMCLWERCRHETGKWPFIRVGDLILKVNTRGVRATDETYTKLA